MTTPILPRFARRAALGAALIAGLSGMDDSFPFSPALPPPLGRVDISAGAADPVSVYVEGELMTDRTPALITVPAGEVTLVLRKPGYPDREESLTIVPLETVELHVEMVP